MNAFQILDKENNPISIGTLDKEVCDLMGVEPDKKWYCTLGRREDHKTEWDYLTKTSNWYDTIGWMIASENKSFQDILDYYAEPMQKFIGEKDETGTVITLEYIYPYHTKVLNSWINKGYIAKQIIKD
jgi:hypothetical protein